MFFFKLVHYRSTNALQIIYKQTNRLANEYMLESCVCVYSHCAVIARSMKRFIRSMFYGFYMLNLIYGCVISIGHREVVRL